MRNKTRLPTLTTFIQHSIGSPRHSNQARKKVLQIGRKKIKLSLCADYIILYIENPEDSIRKLLELINKFSIFAGYKINIYKSVVFIYTNNIHYLKEKSRRQSHLY